MQEGFLVGAYWGPRFDEFSESAAKFVRCLKILAETDKAFCRWLRVVGRGKSRRWREVQIAEIPGVLRTDRVSADIGQEIIEDAGFRILLWNGGDKGEGADVSIRFSGLTPGVGNVFLLSVRQGSLAGRLYRLPLLIGLCENLIAIWNPDWLVIRPDSLSRHPEAQPLQGGPRTGWGDISGGSSHRERGVARRI